MSANTPPLTITLDDPDTIALLLGYQAFIASEDGIGECSLDDAAIGLIAGCLDGHSRFSNWRKANPDAATNLVRLDTVRRRPALLAPEPTEAAAPRRAAR